MKSAEPQPQPGQGPHLHLHQPWGSRSSGTFSCSACTAAWSGTNTLPLIKELHSGSKLWALRASRLLTEEEIMNSIMGMCLKVVPIGGHHCGEDEARLLKLSCVMNGFVLAAVVMSIFLNFPSEAAEGNC